MEHNNMNDEIIKQAESLLNIVDKANKEYIKFWVSHIFLSWRWWLCTVLVVALWFLWIIFRKKKSTNRLLFAGSIVMSISCILDAIGEQLGIWSYNVDVEPFSPSFITFDITLLPIATMWFLQYKPRANPVIKAVVYSGIGSFIAQPVFAWLGIYNRQGWKDYYSFPFLFIIYLIAHFCATRENFDRL
jgi:hypothetical protein